MTKKIAQIYRNPIATNTLIAIFACSIFLYVYSVRQTIFNTVKRQTFETKIGDLRSQIAHLETQSLALKSNITLESAKLLGFREVTDVEFVSRDTLGKVSFESNEF